jgi:predicted small secreted protein
MNRILSALTVLVLSVALAACSTTPSGSNEDANAAGNFLPTAGTFSGYEISSASTLTEAITAAAGEGAAALDNPAVARTVDQVDAFIDCYTNVGAVDANIYTQLDLGGILSSGSFVPNVGTVAVVNQDRVQENFVACVTGGQQAGATLRSQTMTLCNGSGSFTSGGDTFRYIYISNETAFCTAAQAHFDGISG